jgi:hypothetical protein
MRPLRGQRNPVRGPWALEYQGKDIRMVAEPPRGPLGEARGIRRIGTHLPTRVRATRGRHDSIGYAMASRLSKTVSDVEPRTELQRMADRNGLPGRDGAGGAAGPAARPGAQGGAAAAGGPGQPGAHPAPGARPSPPPHPQHQHQQQRRGGEGGDGAMAMEEEGGERSSEEVRCGWGGCIP